MNKKAVSLLLSILLVVAMTFSTAMQASAAKSATLSFDVKKFDGATGSYASTGETKSGDVVYIAASLSRVDSLGGVTFTLQYDQSFFALDKSKSYSVIDDNKSDTFFMANNGKITVGWETLSADTSVNGLAFYIALQVIGSGSADADFTFPAKVVEMFDGSQNQYTINCEVQNTPSVKLVTEQLPQSFLDLAESLKTVTYNPKNDPSMSKDSLNDIKACEEAFAGLTTAQQNAFKNNYAGLYETLSTARTRYYRLSESEADKIVLKEIEQFKSKFEAVLKLNADTVKLSDKTEVNNAYNWMQNILSAQAKAKLDDTTKELVKSLYNRIKQLEKDATDSEDASKEVNAFLTEYGFMFTDIYKSTFESAYDVEKDRVGEALMVYDYLCATYPAAEKLLEKEYATLKDLGKLVDVYAANDAELAALLQKVSDFQQAYIYVYTLNTGNVSVADKSALEMVISAYNRLTDEKLKSKLEPKVKQFENLLKVIEEMEKLEGDDLPGAAIVDASGDDSSQDTPSSDSKNVIKNVTKWLTKNLVTETGLNTPVVILLIMVGISVCCLIVSAALSEYANNLKKRKDDIFEEI